MTSASIVSGLIYRQATLDSCINEVGFQKANQSLCTNAERIESVFTNYLNPLGNSIQASATYLKEGVGSIFDKSWSATTAGAGIISGLIYRQSTLDSCINEEGFQKANQFLCTNAGRIETLFADYLNPLGNSIAEHAVWAKDGAIHYSTIAGRAIGQAALDPTVQKGALAAAATGIALYGLHALATKVQQHYAPKAILPMHDIEHGSAVPQGIPVAELVSSDTDFIPSRKLVEPSVPPLELMQPDEDNSINPLNNPIPSAPPSELVTTEEVNPPLELPPINTDLVREEAPVSFFSKIGSMFRSFTSAVRTLAYNLYTALTQFWNNYWTKQSIEKN